MLRAQRKLCCKLPVTAGRQRTNPNDYDENLFRSAFPEDHHLDGGTLVSLSYRQVAELLLERGVSIDHSTVNRWDIRYPLLLAGQAKRRLQRIGPSWRTDETYICIKDKRHYLYREVDQARQIIDCCLSKTRDEATARRVFLQTIRLHGCHDKITIDGSAASLAALEQLNAERGTAQLKRFEIRQIKFLNNFVEQDHRAVKRITRPMMNFNAFVSAAATRY